MATATLTGTVDGQVAAGEAVTWHIINPDGTTIDVPTTTQPDLSFTAVYSPTLAGDYASTLHIDADAKFTAADVKLAIFTVAVALTPRTISGSVVVT